MTLSDRLLDLAVGGPIRSVALGAALLYAAGHCLGWWLVAGFAGLAIADAVWCASRMPERWRPWL